MGSGLVEGGFGVGIGRFRVDIREVQGSSLD